MDSEDFGGLFWCDITHLEPLKSVKSSIVDLSKDERFNELFSYLLLRLGSSRHKDSYLFVSLNGLVIRERLTSDRSLNIASNPLDPVGIEITLDL